MKIGFLESVDQVVAPHGEASPVLEMVDWLDALPISFGNLSGSFFVEHVHECIMGVDKLLLGLGQFGYHGLEFRAIHLGWVVHHDVRELRCRSASVELVNSFNRWATMGFDDTAMRSCAAVWQMLALEANENPEPVIT